MTSNPALGGSSLVEAHSTAVHAVGSRRASSWGSAANAKSVSYHGECPPDNDMRRAIALGSPSLLLTPCQGGKECGQRSRRCLSPTDSRGTRRAPHGANPDWRFVSAAGRYRVRLAAGRVSTRRRGSDRRASLEDGARRPPREYPRTAAGVASAVTGSWAAPCRSRPCRHSLAGMNEYEMASLAASRMAAQASLASAAAAAVAASGIWVFGIGMLVQNWRRAKAERHRAEAEKDRHTESMEADRRRHEEAMAALTELIRRTAPPSSQAGPPPGPAE